MKSLYKQWKLVETIELNTTDEQAANKEVQYQRWIFGKGFKITKVKRNGMYNINIFSYC